MRIGELARRVGVSTDTLRFYEKIGLLRSFRSSNGYREYPEEVADLVRYIHTAKQLGFTLAEIGSRIPELWGKENAGDELSKLFEAKVRMIDERIGNLQALKAELLQRARSGCPLAPAEIATNGPATVLDNSEQLPV